ncbi:hypothetical protein JCM11491_001731 [Sporobolomyces phaffii]
MDDREPLRPLLDALQAALIPPTRSAAQLPASSDLSFERTLSRSLARQLDHASQHVLALAQSLVEWTTPGATALDPDLVKDGEYANVEPLLEHADEQIEKHLGLGKHKRTPTQGAIGAKSFDEMEAKEKSRTQVQPLPARLVHDSTLAKPQLLFTPRTRVVPPSPSSSPSPAEIPLWKPILRTKVNPRASDSDVPWLETELYHPTSRFTAVTDTEPPPYARYVHPYKLELEHLEPPRVLLDVPATAPAAIPHDSFERTPFEWVATKAALVNMLDEIRTVGLQPGAKELAIDLEHHDFRTWAGFTCLIQLSTREKDYVIDALDPQVRDSLEDLNEFLTDPAWIKVLHGANSDIVWLQRDFGLYIVGLFDTYHATHVLGYAQHSLASLLDMYTDFVPDKRYQLADWRIRPLPKEMLHYARSDTHYLLTIYDHLRIALANKARALPAGASDPSPLEEVFARSVEVSATVFSLAPFDDHTGHFDSGFLTAVAKAGQLKAYATAVHVPSLPIKTGWGPGEVRFEVVKAVMRWREHVARELDESPRYVVALAGVVALAEHAQRVVASAAPGGEAAELVRVLGGARGGVSDVVRRRKDELVDLVRDTIRAVDKSASRRPDDDDDAAEVGEHGHVAASVFGGSSSGLPSFEPTVAPVPGLWEESLSNGGDGQEQLPKNAVASTSTSSFFGGAAPRAAPPASRTSIAPSSTFFGAASSVSTSTSRKQHGKGKQAEDRLAAVRRVHESLTLGGGLSTSLQPHKVPGAATAPLASSSADKQTVSVVSPVVDDSSVLPVPLPIPDASFVPFASTSNPNPKAIGSTAHGGGGNDGTTRSKDDVIVVSALEDKPSRAAQHQLSAKKRRRGTTVAGSSSTDVGADSRTGQGQGGGQGAVSPPPQPPQAKKQKKKKSTSSAAADDAPAPIVPHDYTGATSILDAGPPAVLTGLERREADKKQKKKDKLAANAAGGKKARPTIDQSEFKRPMRVNNAPKSASVSKTFQS